MTTNSRMDVTDVTDSAFVSMPPTSGAITLKPSQWPSAQAALFEPREFDISPLPAAPAVISRYAAVRAALLDGPGWSRKVPVPEEMRHRTLYASWGADGDEHKMLWESLRAVNRGSSDEARAYTVATAAGALAAVMAEDPPWDLARVIYGTSIALIINKTLQAPPLVPHIRQLRELCRDHLSAPGGFFAIRRQPEAEDILGALTGQVDALPGGGLARHLVELHHADPGRFTLDHLVGQLWLMIVSHETQATATATLLGMLFEFNEIEYARSILGDPVRLRMLIEEGYRRGPGFPASLMTRADGSFSLDGHQVPERTPCLASYAAANLDPRVFAGPATFDPRLARPVRHMAFGVGNHRCQGEAMAIGFAEDMFAAMLPKLGRVRLANDRFVREGAGISLSVARLLAVPDE
jgi:cytochrome P450